MKINIFLESLTITEHSKLLEIIEVELFNLLLDVITNLTKSERVAKNVLDDLFKKKELVLEIKKKEI